MTNAVLPVMRQQRSGRIVNISSLMGLIRSPFMALYASSKHAVGGYSQSLDHEVRNFGIRVLLVEPGSPRTTFESSALAVGRKSEPYGRHERTPKLCRAMKSRKPTRRKWWPQQSSPPPPPRRSAC